jgi:hypothetical protein
MNVKSAIAKMYLPPGLKARGLLEMYFNLVFFLYQELESRNTDASEILRKVCAEVGRESAETMKKEVGLTDTFEDAVTSWVIGSKAMNVTISLDKKKDEVVFNHLHCPMWEYFRGKGRILCEDVCIPVAETMAKEICPGVTPVVLRKPDQDHTCVKGLKMEL